MNNVQSLPCVAAVHQTISAFANTELQVGKKQVRGFKDFRLLVSSIFRLPRHVALPVLLYSKENAKALQSTQHSTSTF